MFLSIFSGIQHWFMQVQSLLLYRFNHLTPQEYTMMLLFCIATGLFLLRGRS